MGDPLEKLHAALSCFSDDYPDAARAIIDAIEALRARVEGMKEPRSDKPESELYRFRRMLMRLSNWHWHEQIRDYPSNVLDQLAWFILDVEAGRVWLDQPGRHSESATCETCDHCRGVGYFYTNGGDSPNEWRENCSVCRGTGKRVPAGGPQRDEDGMQPMQWTMRESASFEAFASAFGTVRACVDCSVLIAGGPSRCVACVRRLESDERAPAGEAASQASQSGD